MKLSTLKPAWLKLPRLDKRRKIIAAIAAACVAVTAGALYLARDTGPVKSVRAWWSGDKSGHAVPKVSDVSVHAPRRVLYYRNPMGLPDTSPVPKKDEMGMDYVPVYADDEKDAASQVAVDGGKMQKLGVRTEPAAMRTVARSIRATGRVEVDERQIYVVAPRFEGWVEQLHVGATGQFVEAGETLLEAYSPELNAVQREYLAAQQLSAAARGRPSQNDGSQLAQASLARLRNFGVPGYEIDQLRKTGKPKRTFGVQAPVSGYVLEKKATNGSRFAPGDVLYQIADLSSVWVVVDVFEQDIAPVRTGQTAKLKFNAYPGKEFSARVTFVSPTVNAQTHTTPVRLELHNPQGLLRPGMYADVELQAAAGAGAAVSVPVSAVIDSGVNQTVLVERGDGRFEPRTVKLGMRNDQYVEVLQGVSNGERVVVNGNFLLDAESNLRAAVAGFGKNGTPRAANAANVANAANTAGAPGSAAVQEAQGAQGGAAAAITGRHHARGTVRSVDLGYGRVKITHEPVAGLGWPAMTTPFKAGGRLIQNIVPGMTVEFDFIENDPNEFVLVAISAAAETAAPVSTGRVVPVAPVVPPMPMPKPDSNSNTEVRRAPPEPAKNSGVPILRRQLPAPTADWNKHTIAALQAGGGQ